MPISSYNKDLFRSATTHDKLSLFQTILDAKEDMTVDVALALLKTIHKELTTHQTRDRSAYKLYAEAIESLRYHMVDVLRQVVAIWKNSQSTAPDEWFHDNNNI